MPNLSVNVNKIATLRNARGGERPNVVQVAMDCENFGAQGITVHPRPDERHITKRDVYDLAKVVKTEFNIEGNPTSDFINLVLDVKPDQVTLVPDAPDVLTSNAGWDVKKNKDFLNEVIQTFKKEGIRTSLFMETDKEQIKEVVQTGADRIELYTEMYAKEYENNAEQAIAPYAEAAELASSLGLGLNAGHDLNLQNLQYFAAHITGLLEVSIGHALVSDALYLGLENTVQLYKRCLK